MEEAVRRAMGIERIGEALLRRSLMDEGSLRAALEEASGAGIKTGEAAVRLGLIAESDLALALAESLGLDAVFQEDFPQEPVPEGRQPALAFLKANCVLPIALADGALVVALADPTDPFPAEALSVLTGLPVSLAVGAPTQIREAIDRLYGGSGREIGRLVESMDEAEARSFAASSDEVEELKEAALEAPVINLVNLIITRAVDRRASDIHLEPFEGGLSVRYRVDGVLFLSEVMPARLHPVIASRVKIMARLNIAERRLPQDGRIKYRASGKEIDIRVSTVPALYGECVVMRLLDPGAALTLESLGFPGRTQDAFCELVRQPHGMVLVTGPTGSGKSTTLYAALSKIDTAGKKVITLEDPIEYKLERVNQIQVKPGIGLSFASALRSVVRQDPDVIMVGEVRDAETADIAVHSALTGHLILSTLHTNDAPGAVTRLLEMGVEGYLISSCLLGVLAQRLVRVICASCKEAYPPTARQMKLLELAPVPVGGRIELFRGSGCEACGNTGYMGRTGIFEMMPVTESIRELLSERRGSAVLRSAAVAEGMVELRADGWEKALSGVTTIEEVERVTVK